MDASVPPLFWAPPQPQARFSPALDHPHQRRVAPIWAALRRADPRPAVGGRTGGSQDSGGPGRGRSRRLRRVGPHGADRAAEALGVNQHSACPTPRRPCWSRGVSVSPGEAARPQEPRVITSPSNQHIAQLHSLHTPNGRAQEDAFLIEGPHLLDAALDAHLVPRLIVYDPEQLGRGARGRQLLARLDAARAAGATALEAAPAAPERASAARTPQGVVAAGPTAPIRAGTGRARARGRS